MSNILTQTIADNLLELRRGTTARANSGWKYGTTEDFSSRYMDRKDTNNDLNANFDGLNSKYQKKGWGTLWEGATVQLLASARTTSTTYNYTSLNAIFPSSTVVRAYVYIVGGGGGGGGGGGSGPTSTGIQDGFAGTDGAASSISEFISVPGGGGGGGGPRNGGSTGFTATGPGGTGGSGTGLISGANGGRGGGGGGIQSATPGIAGSSSSSTTYTGIFDSKTEGGSTGGGGGATWGTGNRNGRGGGGGGGSGKSSTVAGHGGVQPGGTLEGESPAISAFGCGAGGGVGGNLAGAYGWGGCGGGGGGGGAFKLTEISSSGSLSIVVGGAGSGGAGGHSVYTPGRAGGSGSPGVVQFYF